MKHYLLAKYVEDRSRNEPRNIGVIVYDGSRAVARFDGEDEATDKIDLRRVRNRITGSRSYRAWVEYWRRALNEPGVLDPAIKDVQPGDPSVIDRLLALPGMDFYLEEGGSILHDADDTDLWELAGELFARLVKEDEAPAPPSLREKSYDAFVAAGAPVDDETRFKEKVPFSFHVQGVPVEEEISYGVKNGEWHYLQAVPFDSSSRIRSQKEASHAVFLLEHALAQEERIVLYDNADVVAPTYPLLEMLRQFAVTVDVNDTEHAASVLQQRLSL